MHMFTNKEDVIKFLFFGSNRRGSNHAYVLSNFSLANLRIDRAYKGWTIIVSKFELKNSRI
jgi:hypothetical protein